VSARDHADKFGIVGAAFAALCCLGISAVLSVVSAIGLGFLIHDAVLLPLLIVSLLVAVWGLYSGWRRHRRPAALIIGGLGAVALIAFSYFCQSRLLALLAIGALIVASFLNVTFLRRQDAKATAERGGKRQ
jgi:mercuric ion transport protein